MHSDAKSFWHKKRVLLTGHTGFKGSWMALWLSKLGAEVTGVGLRPETPFYESLQLDTLIHSRICDICAREKLAPILKEAAPEIIIHMAAQSLVRRSFREPVATFETNLMGTVNVLSLAAHLTPRPALTLVVTSDKVYSNREDGHPFTEKDPLGGDDPYSASKACAELAVTGLRHAFKTDFLLATARAGNVIGGGDFSEDRLIPDIINSWETSSPFTLRNPSSVRPWQHVLDVLAGYLLYIENLCTKGPSIPLALNFGPDFSSFASTARVTQLMETALGCNLSHSPPVSDAMPEKKMLQLDASLAARALNWKPRLSLDKTVEWTADWYKARRDKKNMQEYSLEQIAAFETLS